ncbi:MAG: hypothetical protein JEZ08_25355 [Clostridiales bacterium]|nr:hypothetical protein [Clostridiales bacterium]
MAVLFYFAPTSLKNEKLENQKSVRISTIENTLQASPIKYEELRHSVLKASFYSPLI